ncbi:Na(+)/H(+) antiporter subunit D [Desulfoferula mesophila]|uniref:Na(+)/H(+) antiporter subunit D n=1 Tax=Desulfoferula mesophila TaxID=3058419 RepID=A0AAU9EFY7_9BACT|nr:Na(+)/H(+) antiporter subunit D [Desulfoferula mesophilus]
MISGLPPALLFLAGAAVVPLLPQRFKQAFMLALPLFALYALYVTPLGTYWSFSFLDYQIVLMKLDRLSRVFAYIFLIISVIGLLFALKVEDDLQHSAALVYAGGALGVTLCGDWFSLYVYWEFMAVASTFLILARRTPQARRASLRYILVHLFGGLLLFAGIMLLLAGGGGIAIGALKLEGPAAWLIFLGIALNAAIPPLHPWLKDAYPEATPTGAVFLSAFTTKSAVYLMCRTFAGAEVLIWVGAIMTIFPIFYAVLENDIRRVLSYSLMNQVGYMMCGIGIGTTLAINGTVGHAFCHILYKALLFMAAGSVLTMTGRIRCTDLGGLYKTMPLTAVFCMVGSASISAFPLFSGFVSKSMIVSAAGLQHLTTIWFMLQFASVGVIDHAGIKVPYFTFFGHDSGVRASDPPWNMTWAMGIAAVFCLGLGVFPQPLYALLPFPVDYAPYTGAHVVGQLQLLLFGALAFVLLIYSGYYPAEIRAINLDFDWFYRKGGRAFYRLVDWGLNGVNAAGERWLVNGLTGSINRFARQAPAITAKLVLVPVWWLFRVRGWPLERRKRELERGFARGALPVGVGAMAALMMLLVLYLLA